MVGPFIFFDQMGPARWSAMARGRTIDDEQPWCRWIKAPLNRIINERLDRGGVLGRTLKWPLRAPITRPATGGRVRGDGPGTSADPFEQGIHHSRVTRLLQVVRPVHPGGVDENLPCSTDYWVTDGALLLSGNVGWGLEEASRGAEYRRSEKESRGAEKESRG